MKQHIVRIALGLLVALVLVGHAAKLYQVGFITQLDNIIYDYRLRLTMPATVDKITALLQKLFDKYGVLLVGIDVIFAEPDTSSGLPVLERLAKTKLKAVPSFQAALNELRSELDYDAIFAKFIRGRPVVLGYYFSSEENAVESGALPEPVLPAGTFAGPTPGTPIPWSTRTACRGACRCSKNSRAGITKRCRSQWYVCTSVCRKRRATTARSSPFPRS